MRENFLIFLGICIVFGSGLFIGLELGCTQCECKQQQETVTFGGEEVTFGGEEVQFSKPYSVYGTKSE